MSEAKSSNTIMAAPLVRTPDMKHIDEILIKVVFISDNIAIVSRFEPALRVH